MKFRILPDNIQSVTTIFNSKTTSISPKDFNVDFARIDILDESIDEINYAIKLVKEGKRFEGKDFTNGAAAVCKRRIRGGFRQRDCRGAGHDQKRPVQALRKQTCNSSGHHRAYEPNGCVARRAL